MISTERKYRNLGWSVRQDLNLRPLVPKTSALPSCATHRSQIMVRKERLELSRREALEPKSSVSTNFTTSAICAKTQIICNGVGDGARTHDHRNHNPGLYQLSYTHHCVHLDRLLGAPSRARTCNLRLRRPLLYPIELWAPNVLPDLPNDWMEVVICEEVRILRPDLQVVNTLFYFFKHFFWF